MGVFKSVMSFDATPALIPTIVSEVCEKLRQEEYEVHSDILASGGADITVTKGGFFMAVVGLKSALKVTIIPNGNHAFTAEAGVGIFGQQAIPTAITMLIAWPVMIPQIWGMIQQSKLDDHVLELIQQSVNHLSQVNTPGSALFCPECGHKLTPGDKFCGGCGKKL